MIPATRYGYGTLRVRRRMEQNIGRHIYGCVGKIRYPSRRVELAALRNMVRDCPYWLERAHLSEMHAYKCKGHYHLGHGR